MDPISGETVSTALPATQLECEALSHGSQLSQFHMLGLGQESYRRQAPL